MINMNIKDKLLSSVAAYQKGGSIDAPLRKVYVPSLFSSGVVERATLAGRITGLIQWVSRNEDRRWKGLFKEAVKSCTQEEMGQFIGEKGEAFYRFRASLESGELSPILQGFQTCFNAVGNGDRSVVLSHSILDQAGNAAKSEILEEILGGRGSPAALNGLVERVLSYFPMPFVKDALPLDEEIQAIINEGNQD